MQLRSSLAVLAAVIATAAGSGATAAAADDAVLPPVLTDNTFWVDVSNPVFDPVGHYVRQIDADTYVVTVTNPNTDAVCGIAAETRRYILLTPLFPKGWNPATSGWATHPDPVLPGQTRTFSIDVAGWGATEIEIAAACEAADGTVSSLVTRTIDRMAGEPGQRYPADFGSS